MSSKVAPWLQGLGDETWETPMAYTGPDQMSSASHDASSLRSNSSRIPRRSLSGLPSTLGTQKTSSQASTQIKRSPLAPLNNVNGNTMRGPNGTTRFAGARSVSETSGDALQQCGTVQQRSKSASPAKKQETLEWKKRLVNGQLGYGDQTDLFGPSGLENIFARSSGHENEAPKAKSRINWLQKSDVPMPSSPPPWPSSFSSRQNHESALEESLEEVDEEAQQLLDNGGLEDGEGEGSFRSNPFDLRYTDELEESRHSNERSPDPLANEAEKRDLPGNRTVSGQTELEQEDFSPVYISKHTTVNGQVDYAALDSHLIKQFQSVKVDLRHPSQEQAPVDYEDPSQLPEQAEQSAFTDGPESDSLPAPPDLSMSENLPTGTPPAPSLGRNVELKRGGYSAYGSFKHRPLSPSPSKPEESVLPEQSDLLSPIPQAHRPLPAVPARANVQSTPVRSLTPEPPKSRPSGSPLKLFAMHDTFTNNRLLRRMSQLDFEAVDAVNAEASEQQLGAEFDRADNERLGTDEALQQSFGSGELDDHGFDAEITITSASDSNEARSLGSPGSEIPVPGGREPLNFRFESSPEVKDTFKLKRKLSKHSTANSKGSVIGTQHAGVTNLNPTVEDVSELDAYYERADQVRSFDGNKRPPTSPFKNPTPKRRRTLHASELEDQMAAANSSYIAQIQEAASSRKRKDARHGSSQNTADPDILASRKILRPRNPTPSQRRRQQVEAELREVAEEFAAREPEKLEAVMEQIESSLAGSLEGPATLQQQAEAVAVEVANFSLRIQKPSGEHGERKRSVTTQDFLNEAMMVMQLIRAKARPQSGLGSVEEGDAEEQDMSAEASMNDCERSLRLSRPPSREGRSSGWRTNILPQVDARVVSHLRKFQERDDTEFIAESIASLHVDDEDSLNDNVVVVDEHSNIRITGPPAKARDEVDESRPVSQRSQGSTLGTQQSAGTSTSRTGGTSSTRKSDNVGTLAPDAVAHLIGEQVGGMTFDRDKQQWVRLKSPAKKETTEYLEPPSHLTSDDDPFREISDLPVDEQIELRRISTSGKIEERPADSDEAVSVHDQQPESEALHQPSVESRNSSTETVIPRPVTRDSSHLQSRIQHAHSSSVPSVPSRYTEFASSQQQEKVETRATSWSDEELARLSTMGKARDQPLAYAAAQATLALRGGKAVPAGKDVNEVTEVSLPSLPHQEVDGWTTDGLGPHGRGQPAAIPDIVNGLREDTVLDPDDGDVQPLHSMRLRQTPSKMPFAPPSTYRGPTSQMSLRRKTLTHRITAEAHEQSELSLVAALPGERMMSLSLSVSRPLTKRHQSRHIAELQSSPSKGGDPNATLLLSDLPDFTVHETDEDQRPSERALATRLAQHASAEVNDRYASAVKELVKTLTDVQEDEPYWEDVKQLDLHERALASLYGLGDFCTRVQDMDVSQNALTQVHGAPQTVRRLLARHNQLSSLTCWGHLMNLQYLDISDNQLDNLSGLRHLIHLRELCAEDNLITSLDGIAELDGLLKLRLRRNRIEHVDFVGCQFQRLTDLDLGDNLICAVEHVEELLSLQALRLDGNLLQGGLRFTREMPVVQTLSVRGCGLESFDATMLPSLRHLNVDDNSLVDIGGLSTLKGLDVLSIRRQGLPEDVQFTILDRAVEARTLQLSGNTLPSLHLSTSFLNLQHLEIASVGLQELPPDFGLRMPNLRTLNLNFNALRDIRPLLNIEKLEQLSVCGNRLDRLRKSVATLAKLPTLVQLDMRDNPVTQGFYAPVLAAHTSVVRRSAPSGCMEEDEIAATLEVAKHVLPCGTCDLDRHHQARLDEETKLRRRVYELLLAHNCSKLHRVDSLPFSRQSASAKDQTWKRLMELGIVKKSRHDDVGVLE